MKHNSVIIPVLLMIALTTGFAGSGERPGSPMVIIDPFDKQNIRGNVSIAYVWGEQLDFPLRFVRGLFNLKNAVLKWTSLNITFEEHVVLSSERLHSMPFVYVTSDDIFELTKTERLNVRKYLENGGFMVLENAYPKGDFSISEASLKKMVRDAVPNTRFAPIPISHPLYHSFFDFDDGPPIGAELGRAGRFPSPRRYYLEGVWIGDRLVAIYSNKGYIIRWSEEEENDPQLRMGVNMIVFALTQEDGIASHR